VRGGDLVHAAEHVGQLGARDHPVHDHVGGRDAAKGAKGGLAPLPQELALLGVTGHPHVARARLTAGLHDARGLLVHAGGDPVHLDEQRGGRVARVAAAEGVLDRLDREVIDHLHRGGNEAAGDDGRHGVGALVHLVEDRQHRLERLRLLQDAHDDLGGDAEGALGAHEEPVRS
jgi:hypothetical protein